MTGLTIPSGGRRSRSRSAFHWGRQLPPKAKVGLFIVGLSILFAIVGPFLAPYNPSLQNSALSLSLHAPDSQHLLGTTQTGQDVLSQLLVGIRSTVVIGLVTGIVATALSVIVGLAAGYLGGLWDEVLSLLTNIFLIMPALPLLIVLIGYLPGAGSAATIVVLSVLGWPWGARIIRAQTLSLRNRDFAAAARETGDATWRILFVEILPNEVSLIAAAFVGTVLYAIGTATGLAFLGLANLSSWTLGTMLYWAQSANALEQGAWWWFIPPGLVVAVIGTGLVLVNFGLDELSNPQLRSSGQLKRGRRRSRRTSPVAPTRVASPPKAAIAPSASLQSVADQGGSRAAPVLSIENFSVRYESSGDDTQAVRGVSLDLYPGEILGLAGESGSGKSTLAYAACRLLREPAVITGGSVVYRGRRVEQGGVQLLTANRSELRSLRWREIAVVFQSALNALNPVLRIEDQIGDAIDAHLKMSTDERNARSLELLEMVGIPRNRSRSYPHQLSGGMRQRVMIAMALAVDPEVVIMDEPTTALDVVVQGEILSEFMALKETLGFSIVFITHDMSLLLEIADRIGVMYAGQLMELGPAARFHNEARHPYTRGLMDSFPPLRGPKRELVGIPGSPPDLRSPPSGCPFIPRCPYSRSECHHVSMELLPPSHQSSSPALSACPFVDSQEAAPVPGGNGVGETEHPQIVTKGPST
jgi:peptide/nickel transport system permease protein